MAIEIKMPQLGESVTEGTVGRWLKQPGEQVRKYEALLEVITDKVDTEVPAPDAGTLARIIVPEGETVRVGTVLAMLESVGRLDEQPPVTNEVVTSQQQTAQSLQGQAGYLSPVVARLLAEHNLDARQIVGTGGGGRVSKQDVLRFLERKAQETPKDKPPPDAPPPGSIPQPQDLPSREKPKPAEAPPADAPPPGSLPPSEPPAEEPETTTLPTPAPKTDESSAKATILPADAELVPLSPMRRAIAEHLARSVRVAPHVTTVMEIDVSRIVAQRAQRKDEFARQDVRLTYTAFFAQAAVVALQEVPVLNGSFTDQGIVLHRGIHLGIAVALDEGLIVPVIRDADERNLLGLARTIGDLSERARTRRLRPDETQGGTFTITNHGVSGSLFATPIINQPQAGILGIGAIQKRAVVVETSSGDAIAIRPMCYCSLTFDHRICDGATADAFLTAFKREIER